MKAILLLSLILLLAAGASHAQEPGIYLYFDEARSSCTATGASPYTVEMWVWVYPGSLSLSGCEFSIVYPLDVVQIAMTKNTAIIAADFGEPQSGWVVGYLACQDDWHWVAHQTLYVLDPLPGQLYVAPHPATGSIAVHECPDPGGPGVPVYGGAAFVNVTSSDPDLKVWGSSFWANQDTVFAGEDLSVSSWAVYNWVCEPASATFSNGYYLSADAVITPSDIFLGSTPVVPGLPAFEKVTFADTSLTVPASVPEGDYYVGVLADDGGDVSEIDETNNYARGPITVMNPRTWYILPDSTGDAPTVQAGIDSASAGDTVLLACGTYYEYDIVMKSGITLAGESEDPACTVIDAQDRGHVISGDGLGGSTTIEALTITGGYKSGGGGIFLLDSDARIRNCMIAGNHGGTSGGGVYCGHSSPTFEACVFAGNEGGFFGGAMACYDSSVATLNSCTMYGNSAPSGAGISSSGSGSVVTADRSIIAFGTGAAVYCAYDGTVTLNCSDVYGNSGGDWTGCIAGQGGSDGNFSEDPLFCEPDSLDFTLEAASACADAPGCGLVGARDEGCGLSSVERRDGSDPAPFGLLSSRPNPSSQTTEIAFSLPEPARVVLTVHDATGRRIAEIANGRHEPGVHRVSWDGTDSAGHAVSPGVYFCRFEAAGHVATRKIVLVR